MEGIHKIWLDTQYVLHLCLAHKQKHTAKLNLTKKSHVESFKKAIWSFLNLFYELEEYLSLNKLIVLLL